METENRGRNETFEEKGESFQRVMLNAILKSGFAGKASLFFKITGEYERFSEEYIALAESAVYLLQDKESGEENRDEALEGGTEERAEKSEIGALKEKQRELLNQITGLEQSLEVEKQPVPRQKKRWPVYLKKIMYWKVS